MNKGEFIEKLSKELDTTKVVATKSLDAVLKCIMESLKTNDNLKFIGFGTFRKRQVKAQEIKTPYSKMVKVPAHKRVSLSVGNVFKKVVNKHDKKVKVETDAELTKMCI